MVTMDGLAGQAALIKGAAQVMRGEKTDKKVTVLMPPNCYGGTYLQAEILASGDPNLLLKDISVKVDVVAEIEKQLKKAGGDAIIFLETPSNPNMKIPDFARLKALIKAHEAKGHKVTLIVDQTLAPTYKLFQNIHLNGLCMFSSISGSKYASAGKTTCGYVTTEEKNPQSQAILAAARQHVALFDNGIKPHQMETLYKTIGSMEERVRESSYKVTAFYGSNTYKDGINFMTIPCSDKAQGFLSGVLSFTFDVEVHPKATHDGFIDYIKNHDLYKNLFSHCVSYGQGELDKEALVYITNPRFTTQGNTSEAYKDDFVRLSLPPMCQISNVNNVIYHYLASLEQIQ